MFKALRSPSRFRGAALVACLITYLPAWSQAQPTATLAIEAQPLSSTLVAIGRAFSITVVASDELTQGREAPAIYGEMGAKEALAEAMAGSDLVAQARGAKTFVIASAPGRAANTTVEQSTDTRVLEEMLVYGTKKDQTLQKTSTSVELFTTERIEDEVLFSVDDILLRTPNVSVNLIGGSNYSIRGVNARGVGGAGTGSTSQLYVDGAPLGLALSGIQSVWDIAQVEVLRGPQSTIQGRNALSGAIVSYTADPTYEWTARARVQAATQDLQNASFAVSGPIIDDQLAFRFSYDQQEQNTGHKEVSTGLDQQFFDIYTARGKLLYEPAAIDGLRVELIAERAETETGDFNFAIAPVAFGDPAFDAFDPFAGETHTRINFSDIDSNRYIADVSYALNDRWTLIGLVTREDSELGRRFNIGLPATINLPISPSDNDQRVTSYELRAAFNSSRVSGWIGAYYFEQKSEGRGEFTVPLAGLGVPVDPPDSLITVASQSRSRITNEAIFADLTIDLDDRWSLNFGARYDRESLGDNPVSGLVTADPPTCLLFGAVPCAVFAAPFAPNEPATPTDYQAFLPRAGVSYEFDDNRSLFFSVARGYRAGGIRQFFDPVTATNITNEFDPEFLTNYELAFRSLWLDGRLSVNANVFFTEWEDQQVVVPSAQIDARLALVENAGESELFGLELNIDHQLTESLSYFVGLGLLRTEFKDFPFAEVPGPFENVRGNSFTTAPETTLAVGVSYEHPSGFYTNWSANYRSDQFSEVANLAVNEVESATLINGRVGYRFKQWNVYAFANNALDDRFATERGFATIDTATGVLTPNASPSYRINFPRVAGVAVEFDF
ncbi:MAG: TonB-dependent receptor [Pseudomonadota bacterium]